jgi:hypothetical protein
VTADATALVLPAQDGLHRLELAGVFAHPHWLAFLCGGLSAAGVSVVSGSAKRTAPLRWESHFLVAGPVVGLDPVALAASRPTARDATPPALAAHEVVRRQDGQVELRVGAPDELGFLARLLSRLSVLTLVPSELHIATVRATVQDRFVLGGIGGAVVSDEAVGALHELLTSLTVPVPATG